MFEVFSNKTVLVTGNTGFKGSWLTAWLVKLGANVIGISIDVPSHPSHFTIASIENKITHLWGDIRNINFLNETLIRYKPDYIFHLAAQALVRNSYIDPLTTFTVNCLGTINLLESLRNQKHPCIAIFITSDKCYDNVEQIWGYRETDRLGGKDPYSGSKGAAELALKSYCSSYFNHTDSHVRVAIARAGNVIGGGDWAADRIVPDCVRAWSANRPVITRNPLATRPWQHVLEPLSGYLTLACALSNKSIQTGEAFNFGPSSDQNFSVADLLNKFIKYWPGAVWEDASEKNNLYEAGLLKLSCDKALHYLKWWPVLTLDENVHLTSEWYQRFYKGQTDIWELTQHQINFYENLAYIKKVVWLTQTKKI